MMVETDTKIEVEWKKSNYGIINFLSLKIEKKKAKPSCLVSSSSESSDSDSILDIGFLKLYNHKPLRTSFN